MATCPDDQLLPRLLSGELSGALVGELETHIDGCPRCQGRLERCLREDAQAGRWRALLQPGHDESRGTITAPLHLETADAQPSRHSTSRYEVDRFLAKGNLGEVFVAIDHELRREVALKQIQPQYAKLSDLRRRFLFESQLTGGLEHPGIVSVHGAGVNSDGIPYYTMQLIRGKSLKEAISELHADPTELRLHGLLQRFQAVCNAVAYAHDRGVLHRDIKPSNVMLGPFGETLLVDWGLAKLVRAEDSSSSSQGSRQLMDSDPLATREGQVVGTPAYMSPEQASGQLEQLTGASDIYSLGATLYELLTGRPAFRGRAQDILQQVCEGRFPAPRTIHPAVDKRLQAICLRAMARDPSARYASAQDLASDVERWLADEPVTACPDRIPARIYRWTRRNKTATAGIAVAALLALILAVAAVGFRQREQNTARNLLSELNASRSRVAETADPEQQEQMMAEARRVERRLERHAFWINSDIRNAIQRARRALDDTEADRQILAAFREFEDASAKFSANENRFLYDEAFRLFLSRLADYPPYDTESPASVAQRIQERPPLTRRTLVEILNTCLVELADSDRPQAEQLRMILDRLDSNPGRAATRAAVVQGDRQRLIEFAQQVDAAEHDPSFLLTLARSVPDNERVALLQRSVRHHPDRFWLRHELGQALFRQSKYDSRRTTKAQVSATLQASIVHLTAAMALRPRSAGCSLNLGRALHSARQFDAAMEVHENAIQLSPDFAQAHYNLATTLRSLGRPQEAMAAYRRAIDCNPDYAPAHYNLGVVLMATGKFNDALASYQRAVASDPEYAYGHYGLATVFHVIRKDFDAAVPHYRECIERDPAFLESYNGLGLALVQRQRFGEALAVWRAGMVADPRDARFHFNVAGALHELQRNEEALASAKVAVVIDPGSAFAQAILGELLLKHERYGEAVEALGKSLQLGRLTPPQRQHVHKLLSAAMQQQLSRLSSATALENAQRLRLAEACRRQQRHHRAALLYATAIPALDATTLAHHDYRVQAARSAALAAGKKASDAEQPDAMERQRLRLQAANWLQHELEDWKIRIQDRRPGTLVAAESVLDGWLADDDLTGIRDTAGMPDTAHAAINACWNDVRQTLDEIRRTYRLKRDGGELTGESQSHVHELPVLAGQTYVIDMTSDDLHCMLHVEDQDGKVLDVQTDLLPERDGARVIFTADRAGTVRLVAGRHFIVSTPRQSLPSDAPGKYQLLIRTFGPNLHGEPSPRSSASCCRIFFRTRPTAMPTAATLIPASDANSGSV